MLVSAGFIYPNVLCNYVAVSRLSHERKRTGAWRLYRRENTTTRQVARILADLEDALVEEGLPEDQAETLVDKLERMVDKTLSELDGESGGDAESEEEDHPQ